MRKTPKSSPAEADFLFETDPEPATEKLTSFGGAPLLIRTLRSLEVGQSVARHIKIKQLQRGYDEATNEKREDGPEGFIGFAISARMSLALRNAVKAVAGLPMASPIPK